MDDDNRSPSAPPPPPQTTHPELSYTTIPLNTPATEIRLLELFPSANYSDPLHCRIYTTSISSPVSYTALSYAWGSDEKTDRILVDVDVSTTTTTTTTTTTSTSTLCNPQDDASTTATKHTGIIRTTSSLNECLRHIRAIHSPSNSNNPSGWAKKVSRDWDEAQDKLSPLTLWIDQICICQTDVDEKAVQVGLMGQVYSLASLVFIWLGPEADGSDEVMDTWIGLMGEVMKLFGGPTDDDDSGEEGSEEDGEEQGSEEDGEEDGEEEDEEGGEEGGGEGGEQEEEDGEEGSEESSSEETSSVADTDAGTGSRKIESFGDLIKQGAKTLARLWVSGKLGAMFGRTWFTRVWVVQEACLCPRTVFVCGTKMVLHDILGLVGVCLSSAIEDWKLRGGQWQGIEGWDGIGPLERGGEVAGIKITRDPTSYQKYEDLMWSLAGITAMALDSNAIRQCRQEVNSNPEGGGTLPLLRLLIDLYGLDTGALNKQAKLHRDRIFALLGLATDVGQLAIKPDYSNQKGTAAILTQVARAIIERTKHVFALEILVCSQFPKTVFTDGNGEQLPSWVADWRPGLDFPSYGNTNTAKDNINPDERHGKATADTYTACGTHRCVELLATPAPEVLGLRGYLVDIIEEVGKLQCDPRKLDDEEEEYYREVTEPFLSNLDRFWELSNQKNKPIYDTSARREEALWRVPIADTVSEARGERDKSRADSDSALYYKQFRHVQKELQMIWPSPDAESYTEVTDEAMQRAHELAKEMLGSGGVVGAREYMEQFGYLVESKTLYMTQKGYLGMGPHEMKSGDVVVVFPGARIPFVLRPTNEDNTFTYLGDAYCDGIMDGEITSREEKRDFFLV